MQRIVVVLPAPFGPRNPTIRPGAAVNDRAVEGDDGPIALGERIDLEHARSLPEHVSRRPSAVGRPVPLAPARVRSVGLAWAAGRLQTRATPEGTRMTIRVDAYIAGGIARGAVAADGHLREALDAVGRARP